jgi:hypothetical protein
MHAGGWQMLILTDGWMALEDVMTVHFKILKVCGD